MSSFAKSVILFALPLADARFLQEFETIGGSMRNLKEDAGKERSKYAITKENAAECQTGALDLDACQKAAIDLSKKWEGEISAGKGVGEPKGCYIYNGDKVFFNSNEKGRGRKDRRVICQTEKPTKKTTTTTAANTSCFEKNVRYMPAKNSIGQRWNYMTLLSHGDEFGCAWKTTCGSRPDLNSPEMCQIYCQREQKCAFWTYMHWPETKKHECYLQDKYASREAVVKGERERISGKKCCGECGSTDKKPGFFGTFEQLLTAAGAIIAYVVPAAGPIVPVITNGIVVVKTIVTWFSQWFYRRRLLQARYLQNGKEAEELTSALIKFSDEIQNDVNAIEEKAAPRRIARSSEDGLKILLSETSKIKDSANRGNDKESIFNALHVTWQVMKSAKGKFTTEAEKSEYSESKGEMEYLQPFFEKMEGLMELAMRLKDKKQE